MLNSIKDLPHEDVKDLVGAKLKDIKFRIGYNNKVVVSIEVENGGFCWIQTNIDIHEHVCLGGGQLPKK